MQKDIMTDIPASAITSELTTLANDATPTKINDLKTEDNEKTTFTKFMRDEWNKIEQKYPGYVINRVLDMMCDLGAGNETTTITLNIPTCGDEIYLEIRDELKKKNYVNNKIDNKQLAKAKKKKSLKKSMSKNEIIQANTREKFKTSLQSTFDSFSYRRINSSYGFRAAFAEIRLITFMYCVEFAIKNKLSESECYELIVALARTLNSITSVPGISKIACDDLRYNYEKLKEITNFKFEAMFIKYPRLCLSTKYDNVFPNMMIKPYESQIKLLSEVRRRKNGGLFLYKAMIGSGKTSTTIALAKFTETLRILQKSKSTKPSTQIIFACTVEPVRREVCRMAYNKEIPFAITAMENGNVRIINNYICKKDENRVLIVADLDSAFALLSQSDDYILFLDEPTVGADIKNHPITKAVARVLTVSPKYTILSSATLPNSEEIPDIVAFFNKKHSIEETCTIYSKESQIGCQVIQFDGTTIAPQNGCNDVKSLKLIIEQLKTQPFIDRMLTAPVVYQLRNRMHQVGINNIIDLESYFSDITILCQSQIQKVALVLLQQLLETNDDRIIEKVCRPLESVKINDQTEENITEDSGSDIDWEESPTDKVEDDDGTYDLNKIFTQHAYKFAGPCLVTVDDPIKFAQEKSQTLFEGISASKIISKYNANLQRFKLELGKLDKIKNEDEKSKRSQEVTDLQKPHIDFPHHLRINTIHHLNKYAPHMVKKMDPKLLQPQYPLENLLLDMNVPDWMMLLLFAGVGIYAPYSQQVCREYTDTILSMVSLGQLAFLVSDDNICYGANYPISHTVLSDDVADKHSMNFIFQFFGRAGRVGQSWVAYSHVGPNTAKRIMNYIHGEHRDLSEEAKNINTAFTNISQSTKNTSAVNAPKTSLPNPDIVGINDVKQKYNQNWLDSLNETRHDSENKNWRNNYSAPATAATASAPSSKQEYMPRIPVSSNAKTSNDYVPPQFRKSRTTESKDGWTTIAKR